MNLNNGHLQLVGSQTPTHLWVPPHRSSSGREAVELAASAGLRMDPWQGLVLDGSLAESRPGCWQCFEIGLLISRQNGKDALMEARELAGLFLFGERLIIHSAHLFDTAREHFLRIVSLIDNHDAFRRRVYKVSSGKGAEAIELLGRTGRKDQAVGGSRLKFMTRKGGAGRGFSGDCVIFNEAMYLDWMMIAAMMPTLSAQPNPQIYYLGSAGFPFSTQLALVRRRAHASIAAAAAGGEVDDALAWFGWEADPALYETVDGHRRLVSGDDPADPRTWAKTNPGLGIRISVPYVAREMRAMGGPESPAFRSERLGIGDWPSDDDQWEVFDRQQWLELASPVDPDTLEPTAQIRGRMALGVDTDTDRDVSAIGACGPAGDGRLLYEVVQRDPGTGWLAQKVIELWEKHRPYAVVMRRSAASASIIATLERAKVRVLCPSVAEYAQACGATFEDVTETGVAMHLSQASLTAAVASAQKLLLKDGGFVWSPKVSCAPLRAVTLGKWGLMSAPPDVEPFAFALDGPGMSGPAPVGVFVDARGAIHETPSMGAGSTGYATARRGSL